MIVLSLFALGARCVLCDVYLMLDVACCFDYLCVLFPVCCVLLHGDVRCLLCVCFVRC